MADHLRHRHLPRSRDPSCTKIEAGPPDRGQVTAIRAALVKDDSILGEGRGEGVAVLRRLRGKKNRCGLETEDARVRSFQFLVRVNIKLDDRAENQNGVLPVSPDSLAGGER